LADSVQGDGAPSPNPTGSLLEAQQRVLESIVRGRPLSEVLAALCHIIEQHAGERAHAVVLLKGEHRSRMYTAAAPSLPDAPGHEALDRIVIGKNVGTAYAAAARGEVVVTRDIATDPNWAELRHLALDRGLKSAWSMPILSSTGEALGTISTYFFDVREPTLSERQLVKVLAQTASLAIERARADRILQSGARRDRLLAELAAATQPLSSPDELMETTARLLAQHLGASRCAYAEVEAQNTFVITGDYGPTVPSIVGRWPIAAFGPACVRDMLDGRAFVVHDTDTHPEIAPEHLVAYRATNIRAVICVPLHKRGRLTAAMAVHHTEPRAWRQDEVELVRLIVSRCWEGLERTRVARTLQQSRARLDYAVKLSGVGFWYCDLPFDELIWDERVKAHFFLPPEARVTIDTFYEYIHAEDREATRFAIERSIEQHTPYDVVYRTCCPRTQATKWIRALGGTAYDEAGQPQRFDGVTLDVTAQREAQEKLTELLEREQEEGRERARLVAQLRDQERRKDEFLATLAHELRNPLAALRFGLELVERGRQAETIAKARGAMERQLSHLVRMVDDLLDTSRVTLGKLSLQRELVDFRDVVESALETVRPVIETNKQDLRVVLPAHALPIHCDATRLAQVLANLLSNAAKYIPASGRIELRATPLGSQLQVTVTDNGVGIPPDMLDKIFEVFTQIERSVKQAQGGLGLGLTLVRRLVELHGGSVEAASGGTGQGSTFTLRLPLAVGTPALQSKHGAVAPPRDLPQPLRVLVVDDNEDAADCLAALLTLDGHEVQLAHTGPDALSQAQAHAPDVVLLDIGLPGFDGYEVAKRLHAQHAPDRVPRLIAVTGFGTQDDQRRAREAGFDAHLVKPVTTTLLLQALRPAR
jgi:signal transduction histidine kinase/GAF domain-containing protein